MEETLDSSESFFYFKCLDKVSIDLDVSERILQITKEVYSQLDSLYGKVQKLYRHDVHLLTFAQLIGSSDIPSCSRTDGRPWDGRAIIYSMGQLPSLFSFVQPPPRPSSLLLNVAGIERILPGETATMQRESESQGHLAWELFKLETQRQYCSPPPLIWVALNPNSNWSIYFLFIFSVFIFGIYSGLMDDYTKIVRNEKIKRKEDWIVLETKSWYPPSPPSNFISRTNIGDHAQWTT